MQPGEIFIIAVVVIFFLYIINSIKILREYERGVIFRLGRLMQDAKGPGVILVFAPVDKIIRVDLRQQALEVPPQDIITRDNVTLKVNAVIYWRVVNAPQAVVQVQNYYWQTQQFAQTTLRSVLGEVELDELLAHRDKLNTRIQSILDQHTAPYGVKVSNVEVKQVDLPESMLRAMAKQAEAEREKRAKIIHAEGEFSASQRLMEAAHILSGEPIAIQLRYLQTLTEIGVEKNTTIVFPLPVDMISAITRAVGENWQVRMRGNRVTLGANQGREPGGRMAAGAQMGDKDSDQVRDTEITLSTGKLLGIFFALAIVCGVFFTMGYLLGKSTSAGGRTEIVSTVPTGNSAGKPFAGNKTPETTTQNCPPGSPNCAPAGTSADTGSTGKNSDQQSSASQGSGQPASGGKTPDQSSGQSTGTEVKNGAGSSYMVQVAAVSKQEDAEILITALRKKQYPVFIANSAGDPLFHVQVGPYSEKKDAEAMRVRLASDGYNAIVK